MSNCRKIFIDLGANKGSSIDWCEEHYGLDYQICAFEPLPHLFYDLKKKYAKRGVVLYKQAAWIADGYKYFNVAKNDLSSNFYEHLRSHDVKESITVEVFDFSKWLEANFSDDYVVVKMNIEGAEFPVLIKMIHDGTINMVDELYYQFHPNIEPRPKPGWSEYILKELKARGVRHQPWINSITTRRM